MIGIIDFGAQYSQLIARRVRQAGVYAEIYPCSKPFSDIPFAKMTGVILSGGPASVHEEYSPRLDSEFTNLHVPVLGICYGMQALAVADGGRVAAAEVGEYGRTRMTVDSSAALFDGIDPHTDVWMSHRDSVSSISGDWIGVAQTAKCPIAAVRHTSKPWWGVQFHPEVHHTDSGQAILENFVYRICNSPRDWDLGDWIADHLQLIADEAAGRRVVAAVSGGVDSTVMAALLHKALGEKLDCYVVDNGLMRRNEIEEVIKSFDELGVPIQLIQATNEFLSELSGKSDPEEKRRIIGRVFIEVLGRRIGDSDILAQGTLYPDVIESVAAHGPSTTIKTHHNRVAEVLGLLEQGRIIEPLRDLFKDEVRDVGDRLGISKELLWRHPFPGPGLAVRILGEITVERLDLLRTADAIVVEELKSANLYYDDTWQAFAVLLPIRSTGVMGDSRTYGEVIAIRAVTSRDGMTADWARLPYEVLERMSNRIVGEIRGINRVVYDITSKPPGTIEWE